MTIAGALSGQCDCFVWMGDDGEAYCKEGVEDTCCGAFDSPGGVVAYFLVVFYCFLGLAIICDNYFCESLSRISTALSLSDDVAGATFMAAGSSAPELFTSLIVTLITGGSEGLGTIAGSAVFNLMVIVGVTAVASCGDGGALAVWWYPLVRDSLFYLLSLVLMYGAMYDFEVAWCVHELTLLFFLPRCLRCLRQGRAKPMHATRNTHSAKVDLDPCWLL